MKFLCLPQGRGILRDEGSSDWEDTQVGEDSLIPEEYGTGPQQTKRHLFHAQCGLEDSAPLGVG